jgi:hypothetical protein
MQRVRDPLAQVTAQQYALRAMLHERTGVAERQIKLARGIVLADVTVHSLVLGPDAPPQIVIDRHGVQEIASAIGRVVAFAAGARDSRIAPDRQVVRDLLAPTFHIRVPMAEAFLAEERQLVELTAEQSIALRRLGRNHRMAVYGCAGSGKTMLAVEHARRLAEAGRDVLLVCFNRQLAAHLHQTASHDRIRYSTFHGLCVAQARKAGSRCPTSATRTPRPSTGATSCPTSSWKPSTRSASSSTPSSSTRPRTCTTTGSTRCATGCATSTARRCGSFSTTTSASTTPSCRSPPASCSTSWDQLPHDAGHPPRAAQAARRPGAPRRARPEGRPLELHHAADQPAKVAEILDRLLGPDDVPPEHVVVLSSHGREKSAVAAALAHRLLPDKPRKRDRGVRFSSIRAFKGLESPVVVLCELEDLDLASLNQQLYVGMSRARNHCVLVAPPAAG